MKVGDKVVLRDQITPYTQRSIDRGVLTRGKRYELVDFFLGEYVVVINNVDQRWSISKLDLVVIPVEPRVLLPKFL